MISGVNFPAGDYEVSFGGTPAVVERTSATRIVGQMPDLPKSGYLDVVVTFPDGTMYTLEGEYHFRALEDDPVPGSIHDTGACKLNVADDACDAEL